MSKSFSYCEEFVPPERSRSRSTRERKMKHWRQGVESEDQDTDLDLLDSPFEDHLFVDRRCVRCNTEALDASLYPEFAPCAGKDADAPLTYTTATGQSPVASHQIR